MADDLTNAFKKVMDKSKAAAFDAAKRKEERQKRATKTVSASEKLAVSRGMAFGNLMPNQSTSEKLTKAVVTRIKKESKLIKATTAPKIGSKKPITRLTTSNKNLDKQLHNLEAKLDDHIEQTVEDLQRINRYAISEVKRINSHLISLEEQNEVYDKKHKSAFSQINVLKKQMKELSTGKGNYDPFGNQTTVVGSPKAKSSGPSGGSSPWSNLFTGFGAGAGLAGVGGGLIKGLRAGGPAVGLGVLGMAASIPYLGGQNPKNKKILEDYLEQTGQNKSPSKKPIPEKEVTKVDKGSDINMSGKNIYFEATQLFAVKARQITLSADTIILDGDVTIKGKTTTTGGSVAPQAKISSSQRNDQTDYVPGGSGRPGIPGFQIDDLSKRSQGGLPPGFSMPRAPSSGSFSGGYTPKGGGSSPSYGFAAPRSSGGPSSPGNGGSSESGSPGSESLGASRARRAAELDMHPALKEKMLALAMAETGSSDDKANRQLMETIFNRHEAQGKKSIADTMGADYYEPLQNGGAAYAKNLTKLRSDPKLRERMERLYGEVVAGSNDSNLATHNSSAGVAANAARTQTITSTGNGETFSRKDNPAFSRLHGAGTVQKEGSWAKNAQAAIDAEKQRMADGGVQRVSPGGKGVAPWMSLEKPPTEAEIRKAIASGQKDFHFDPTQAGATEANKLITQLGGNSIGYSPGMGSSEWNSTKRDLTSGDGKKFLQDRVKMMMESGDYSAIHLDEIDRAKPNELKSIIDTIDETSGGKIKLSAKNNVLGFNNLLKSNPEYKDKIHSAIIENPSYETPEDIKRYQSRLNPGTSMTGVDFRAAGPDGKGQQSATKQQSADTAKKTGMPVYSVDQEFPSGGKGGFDTRGAELMSPSDSQMAKSPTSSGQVFQTQGSEARTRKQPISPKLEKIFQYAAAQAGAQVEIYSGGQDDIRSGSGNRVGSTRHDNGNAGDLKLFTLENGKKKYLDFNTPEGRETFQKFTTASAAAGAQGIGAAEGYMGSQSIHVGFGTPLTWGAGGRSANAPDWLKTAHAKGIELAKAGPPDMTKMSESVPLSYADETKQSPTERLLGPRYKKPESVSSTAPSMDPNSMITPVAQEPIPVPQPETNIGGAMDPGSTGANETVSPPVAEAVPVAPSPQSPREDKPPSPKAEENMPDVKHKNEGGQAPETTKPYPGSDGYGDGQDCTDGPHSFCGV